MKSVILCWIMMISAIALHAQEISFTATVDRNTIGAGEPLKLTITLNNSREQFTAPDLGGMLIVQGPFESSSFNYVNGKLSSTVSRTWMVTATSPGNYTIGPSRVRIGGGVLQTDPIKIEVTKGTTRPADPGVQQGQRRDPDLFVTISMSKNKAYVGEQIVASYVLYSRYPNLELSKYELPKLDGFWSEDIETGNSGWEERTETVNGLQYRVAILKRQLLFPQRSGKLRIEPLQLTCIVNRSFFSRGSAVEVTSNSVEITAQALPPAPAGFSGAVGELQMKLQADNTNVRTDDAIDLNIRITGRSNLKLLDAPKLTFPNDFEVYDPKINDRITINANGMSGSREFQYVVIPRHEGNYELEPYRFIYFDTSSGTYQTIASDPITIEVAPGEPGAATSRTHSSSREVAVLDRDIRYIRTGDLDLRPHGELLFGSPLWIASLATPALAFFVFLGWYRKQKADLLDEAGTRRKKADRIARRRLSEAEQALRKNEREPFYTALSKALNGYMADKFGLGIAEVNTTAIQQRLTGLDHGSDLAGEYVHLITACDMARFAPLDDAPRQELYDKAVELIGGIERTTKS